MSQVGDLMGHAIWKEKRSKWGEAAEIDRMTNFHDHGVRAGAVGPRSHAGNSQRITTRHAQNKLSDYCNCFIASVLMCTCDILIHSRLNRSNFAEISRSRGEFRDSDRRS